MIGIQLKGRLGNQMFQYVVGRAAAERIGCSVLFAARTPGRRFGLIGHWLGLDVSQPPKAIQQNGLLRAAFARGPTFWQGRIVERTLPCLKKALFPQTFSPRTISLRAGGTIEEFDDGFFGLESGTWLSGWFQSERYFATDAERVRQWFRPTSRCVQQADAFIAQWPDSPRNMAAIHVRRGDYAKTSLGGQSWLLPASYYHDALERIPKDAGVAVFSDEPDWAAAEFAHRNPWVSRNNSAALDMYLIGRCRWNIIANSTLSWWAAWLNEQPDKIVIAPQYHLGWRVGRWAPGGIDVPSWHYLNVRS